jgi:hypothetical protein
MATSLTSATHQPTSWSWKETAKTAATTGLVIAGLCGMAYLFRARPSPEAFDLTINPGVCPAAEQSDSKIVQLCANIVGRGVPAGHAIFSDVAGMRYGLNENQCLRTLMSGGQMLTQTLLKNDGGGWSFHRIENGQITASIECQTAEHAVTGGGLKRMYQKDFRCIGTVDGASYIAVETIGSLSEQLCKKSGCETGGSFFIEPFPSLLSKALNAAPKK